jgi:tRNA-splicing ligase RtcB (3'-phosphate/5'-hydroxy nucleic acid ligase)
MTSERKAPMHSWLIEPLSPDVRAALDRLRRSDDVQAVAVMPDVHLASDVCVGTVVATSRLLYPNAVGGDIGCGMAAVGFSGDAAALKDRKTAARILAGLSERVPVLKQPERPESPGELWGRGLSDPSLERQRDREGLWQLGTLGRGNHFLELQADEEDRLWLMAHSGSRSIGQAVRDLHLHRCRRLSAGLGFLDCEEPSGVAYLADMAWALGYAAENRRRIVAAAVGVVEAVTGVAADWSTWLSCHHNHVERVGEGDRALWVHRKGAISARDDEPGIIPGSMGTASYHTLGRGVPEALWSSSHGAGRAMSRTEARHRVTVRDLERDTEGVWLDRRKARLLLDEAPGAYKDITKVMGAQRDLTRIVRRLRPVMSYKGV